MSGPESSEADPEDESALLPLRLLRIFNNTKDLKKGMMALMPYLDARLATLEKQQAEILTLLRASAAKPVQAANPGRSSAPPASSTGEDGREVFTVTGALGRNAMITKTGNMVNFSIDLEPGFLRLKDTKCIPTSKTLKAGDVVKITHHGKKTEANYKDPKKTDTFAWIATLEVISRAPEKKEDMSGFGADPELEGGEPQPGSFSGASDSEDGIPF